MASAPQDVSDPADRPASGSPSMTESAFDSDRAAGRHPFSPPPRPSSMKSASGSSYDEERDWRGTGLFAAGILVGALIGAGTALLFAPQSGDEARDQIAQRVRMARGSAVDKWDDLALELRRAGRRQRRRLARSMTRGRWAATDRLDR